MGVELGKTPLQTPRSPQAKPGNTILWQRIFTSFWVGNKTRKLPQDGNMRALPHTQRPDRHTIFLELSCLGTNSSDSAPHQPSALLTLRLSRSSHRPPAPGPDLPEWPPGSTLPLSAPLLSFLLARLPSPSNSSRLSPKSLAHRSPAALQRKNAARLERASCGSRSLPSQQVPQPHELLATWAEAETSTRWPRSPERLEGAPALAPPRRPPHPACPADLVSRLALTSRGPSRERLSPNLGADAAGSLVVMDWCGGGGRVLDNSFPRP